MEKREEQAAMRRIQALRGSRPKTTETSDQSAPSISTPRNDPRFFDYAAYYGEISGLSVTPGRSIRWFDTSPGSNCVACCEFFRQRPTSTTKKHKLWLSPRGSIKSTIMAVEGKREIQLDPETRMVYVSETEELVIQRPQFIRTRLEFEAGILGLENPKTSQWSDKKFTVARPSGMGFDPTLRAMSVEKPSTGVHWNRALLDDVVGEYTNRSAHMRRKIISWFEDFWAQKMNESEVWIVGTLWPGYNLYRWIMDKLSKYFEIRILGTHDDEGKMTYPWYTDDFLREEREGMTEAKYAAQFLNQVRSDDELVFVPEDVEIRGPAGMQLNHYLLTDFGTSTQNVRHTSKSAMFLVGIGYGENAFLYDGWLSKGTLMDSGSRMIGMLQRAHAQKRYPMAYTVETTGPAASAWPYLDELIAKNGLPPLAKIFLQRSTTEKHARIEALQPFVAGHRVFVVPDVFPTGMFRKDASGMAFGLLADSMRLYTRKNDDESWDDLDALADIAATDRVGQWRLVRPQKPQPQEEPDTAHERAKRQLLAKLDQDGTVWLR